MWTPQNRVKKAAVPRIFFNDSISATEIHWIQQRPADADGVLVAEADGPAEAQLLEAQGLVPEGHHGVQLQDVRRAAQIKALHLRLLKLV